MKRLLFTTDWQVSFSRLAQCSVMLSEILDQIKVYDVHAVVHLGDVKEQFSPLDLRVLDFCIDAVRKITRLCPLYILKGNHDMHGTTDAAGDFLHVLELAGATVITKPEVHRLQGYDVAFLPFAYSVEQQREWATKLKREVLRATLYGKPILAFHGEVKGFQLNATRMASGGLTAADIHANRYHMCIGGHLHRYQRDKNILYVGSPFAMDWSDANSPKGNLPYQGGKKKRLLTTIPGYYDESLPGFKEPEDWTGAHVRVKVPCSRTQDNVQAMVHLAEVRCKKKFTGAYVRVLPEFIDDAEVTGVEDGDSDADALTNFVASSYAERAGMPTGKVALAALLYYLGESTRRNRDAIRFIQAKGKNVLSYKQVKFTFNDGLTLVRGVNHDWDDKSNGSGKTSLLQLIAIALFGTTFKKQKADLWARRGSSPAKAWVAVQFELSDGRVCIVKRQRRPSKLQLLIDGKDVSTGRGVVGVQQDIEQITGLTLDTLENAVYIDQSTISAFLYGTEAARYALLQRFMNLERFEAAQRLVKEDIKRTGAARAGVVIDKALLGDRYDRARADQDNAPDADVKALAAQVDEANDVFAKFASEAQGKIKKVQVTLQKKNDRLDVLRAARNKGIGWVAAKKGEAARYFRDAKDVAKLTGKPCPVCTQVVKASALAGHRGECLSKGRLVTSKIERANKKIDSYGAELTVVTEARDKIRVRLDELEREVKFASQEVAKVRSLYRQAKWAAKNLPSQEYVSRLRQGVRLNKRVLKDIDNELVFLTYAASVFHRDGLPSFVARMFYPKLNVALEWYSKEFTDSQIQVRFDVTDAGAKPEVINLKGGERLEDQSEGERRFASIVMCFALRDVARPCNVLILDEPGAGLDPANAKDFSRSLRTLRNKLGCVVLVTHNSHIEAELQSERTLTVVKRDGVSTVRKGA